MKSQKLKVLKFLLSKFISVLIIVIGLTFMAFCLSNLCPSDPVEIQLESMGVVPTPEIVDAMKAELGLDKPFIIQYCDWLWNFLHGNMGTSITTGNPVMQEVALYLPNTLKLTCVSMLSTMLVSIFSGVICAVYADSIFDYFIRFITYFFASFPSFFLALLLLYIMGIKMKLFPIIATMDAKGMVMPVLLLTFTMSAYYIRQIRAIVLEQLNSDYIIGCRARGIPEVSIIFKHVLKNSLVPIVTLTGISFGGLLGGTAIVENIFTWQGLGQYALKAISNLDYTVIQAYVVWMALIFLAVNLFVDCICILINPRLRNTMDMEEA